jgi:ligand-binding sensor domain-containing protein
MKKHLSLALSAFLGLVFPCLSYGQEFLEVGHLPLQHFSPAEYNAFRQNQGIAEDPRGLIYVANKWGILEYDGTEWKTLEGFPDDAEPFDLVIDPSGHLWVAAKDEIGYFLPDASGKLIYKSKSEQLLKKTEGIGQIKRAKRVGDTLYFLTRNKLITWNEATEFDLIETEDTLSQFFDVEGQLLVQVKSKGLYRPEKGQLIPHITDPFFKENELVSITKHAVNSHWLIARNADLFITNLTNPEHFEPKRVKSGLQGFQHGEVLDAVSLGKSRLALSIKGQGVVILNKLAEIVQMINKDAGLKDETVNRLYSDSRHLLWMSTMNGIDVAVENSPLSSKSEEDHIESTVEAITRFKGKLYVATTTGVYYLDQSSSMAGDLENIKPPFTKLPGFEKTGYVLHNYEDELLLIVGEDGLYEFEWNKQVRKVYDEHPVIYSVEQFPSYPGIVFLGVDGGIVALQRKGADWVRAGYISLAYAVFKCQLLKGELWYSTLGTAVVGKVKVKIEPNRITFGEPLLYTEKHGVPKSDNVVFVWKDKMYLASAKGLRAFDTIAQKFILSADLGKRFADTSVNIVRISLDSHDKIWMYYAIEGKGESFGFLIKSLKGDWVWNENYFRSVAKENILAIYHDPGQVTWFGGGSGVHRFDYSQVEEGSIAHPVMVRRSQFGNIIYFQGTFYDQNGLIQVKQTDLFKPELKFESNSFQIAFSSFQSALGSQLKFSRLLEGVDEKWTEPERLNVVNYSNLKPGSYTFKVKSVDENGYESEVSEFLFKILPPWYETLAFYIIQSIFLVSLVVISFLTNRNPKASALSSVLTLITIITIFELIVTQVEPFVESYAGGVPIFKLIMNILLALSLNPLEGVARKLLTRKAGD